MSLYERIAERDPDELRGLVAYGLYKRGKRQWLANFVAAEGRQPNAADLQAYSRTWTDQLIETQQDAADAALSDFGQQVVEAARSAIVEEALKGTRTQAVLLSMLSNLLYTLGLVAFVVVLKVFGIDLISALQSVPAVRQ